MARIWDAIKTDSLIPIHALVSIRIIRVIRGVNSVTCHLPCHY